MISSIYQIDFVDESGGTTRLLDYGDLISDMIGFSARQSAQAHTSLGVAWGGTKASGGARRPLSWSRAVEHASHAVAASYCIMHPCLMPYTRAGKIRVSISGGAVWDMLEAVILDCSVQLDRDGSFGTLAIYQADAGLTLPVSGFPAFSGIPSSWILSTHAAQTLVHSAS